MPIDRSVADFETENLEEEAERALRVQNAAPIGAEIGLTDASERFITTDNAANDVSGAAGDDVLLTSAGNDTLRGGDGDDVLIAGSDADTLAGGSGSDQMSGGDGADLFIVNASDFATGPAIQSDFITDFQIGEDTLRITGFDEIVSFEDLTFLPVETGLAIMLAEGQFIVLEGVETVDQLDPADFEFAADDEGEATVAASPVYLSDAADRHILTGVENDTVFALGGDDVVVAAGGNDNISGGEGLDVLYGGDGDDTLEGGARSDVLTGGAGSDLFRFALGDYATDEPVIADIIKDFQVGVDRIELNGFDFGSLDAATFIDVANGIAMQVAPNRYIVFEGIGSRLELSSGDFSFPDVTPPVVTEIQAEFLTSSPNSIRVTFDEALADGSFTKAAFNLLTSSGEAIEITSVDKVSASVVQVNFASSLPNGDFNFEILPLVTDLLGNAYLQGEAFELTVAAPTQLISISPTDGTSLANLDRHVVLEFDRAIDPETLTSENFQILANFEQIEGRISVSDDGKFATFSLAEGTLFPASTNIRISIDGDTILGADGSAVDVDGDGIAGGAINVDFSTVSVTPIEGTGIFGFIYDSNNRAEDGSDIPLVGVEISVIGLPGVTATTDENGYFELDGLPFPDAYLHFDASGVPAADQFQYGTIVKPVHTTSGQMTQIAKPNGMPFDIFFAAIPLNDAVDVIAGEETTAGLGESGLANLGELFPNIDVTEWEKLKVTVPADALTFDDGSFATELTIMAFEPDRIPAPTPDGFDPEIVFTVMAGGAGNVDGKAQIEFPNLDGLAPGEKRPIMSFDHDAGKWVQTGSAIVSDDGTRLISEGDTGVNTLGWKFIGDSSVATRKQSWSYVGDDGTAGSKLLDAARKGIAGTGQVALGTIDVIDVAIPDEEAAPPLAALISAGKLTVGTGLDYVDDGNIDGQSLAVSTGLAVTGTAPAVSHYSDAVSAGLNFESGGQNLADAGSSLLDSVNDALFDFSAPRSDIVGPRWNDYERAEVNGRPLPTPPSNAAPVDGLEFASAAAPNYLTAFTDQWIADARSEVIDPFRREAVDQALDLRNKLVVGTESLLDPLETGGGLAPFELDTVLGQIAALRSDFDSGLVSAEAEFRSSVELIDVDTLTQEQIEVEFYAAQAIYAEKLAALFPAYSASYNALVAGMTGDLVAIYENTIQLAIAIGEELKRFDVVFDAALSSAQDFITIMPEFADAVHAGEDVEPFRADLESMRDRQLLVEAALLNEGFADLDQWQSSIRERLVGLAENFDNLYLPISDQLNSVFALAERDDGSFIRATLSPGEAFEVTGGVDSSTTIKFFDPTSGFFGEQFVSLGTGSSSGRTFLNQRPALDSDGDGISDEGEIVIGTDPFNPDSDGDNISDGAELSAGSGLFDGVPPPTGILGSIQFDVEALRIAIVSDPLAAGERTAYVRLADGALAIVDVASPATPILQSQIALVDENNGGGGGGGPISIEPPITEFVVVEGRVYAALGDAGLSIVNVEDPLTPIVEDTFSYIGSIDTVAFVDGLLLIAGDARITLIDPASLEVIQTESVPGDIESLLLADGTVYALSVANQINPTLHSYTVSTDGIVLLDSLDLPFPPEWRVVPERQSLFVDDGVAYVSTGTELLEISQFRPEERAGYKTVDVSDPNNLSLLSNVDTGDNANSNFETVTNGQGLGLTAAGTLGLGLYDTSDPSNTYAPIGAIDTPGEARDIEISDGFAFVADGSGGLQIINYLDPDTTGIGPVINISADGFDVDPITAGIQVEEGTRVVLDIDASDNVQLNALRLLFDDELQAIDSTPPFTLSFIMPEVGEFSGSFDVAVDAFDTGGNRTRSEILSFESTVSSVDLDVVRIEPDGNSSISPGDRTFSVTLTREVLPGSISAEDFKVIAGDGTEYSASSLTLVSLSSGQQIARFAFEDLIEGSYSVTFDASGLVDLAGNGSLQSSVTQPLTVGDFTTSWIAVEDGSWADIENWSAESAPGPSDLVAVPVSAGKIALIEAEAGSVQGLNVSGEGSLVGLINRFDDLLTTDTLSNSGNIDIVGGGLIVTGDAINSGSLQVSSDGRVELEGNIQNTGTMTAVAGSGNFAQFLTSGELTTLSGGGEIQFSGGGTSNKLSGSMGTVNFGVFTERFVNVDNTISGDGSFGRGFLLENAEQGTFLAQNGDLLRISTGRLENAGSIVAQAGGTVLFDSDQTFYFGGIFAFVSPALIENSAGEIRAEAGGIVNLGASTVAGGRLVTESNIEDGTGLIVFTGSGGNGFAGLNGSMNAIDADASIIVQSTFLQMQGNISNSGTMQIVAAGEFGSSNLALVEQTVLSGGGSLTLSGINIGSSGEVSAQIYADQYFIENEFGEPILDEFTNQPIFFGGGLVLEDHELNGTGIVGASADETSIGYEDPETFEFFEFVPLMPITLGQDGMINANTFGEELRILNAEVGSSGTIEVTGGDLHFASSNLSNQGGIFVSEGTLRMDYADFSDGGFFYNSGTFVQFGGETLIDVTVFNVDVIQILGGVAEFRSLTQDQGVVFVGDAQLSFSGSVNGQIGTNFGDAYVSSSNADGFDALLTGFGAGDTFEFTELDPFETLTKEFNISGSVGSLVVSDGTSSVEIQFLASNGVFAATEADFQLAAGDLGGVMITTDLEML